MPHRADYLNTAILAVLVVAWAERMLTGRQDIIEATPYWFTVFTGALLGGLWLPATYRVLRWLAWRWLTRGGGEG